MAKSIALRNWVSLNNGMLIAHEKLLRPTTDWTVLEDGDLIAVRLKEPQNFPVIPDLGGKPYILPVNTVLAAQITEVHHFSGGTTLSAATLVRGKWYTIKLFLKKGTCAGSGRIAEGPALTNFGLPKSDLAAAIRNFSQTL